jgi:hypothetical protein
LFGAHAEDPNVTSRRDMTVSYRPLTMRWLWLVWRPCMGAISRGGNRGFPDVSGTPHAIVQAPHSARVIGYLCSVWQPRKRTASDGAIPLASDASDTAGTHQQMGHSRSYSGQGIRTGLGSATQGTSVPVATAGKPANRTQSVLVGVQNRTLGPYLAAAPSGPSASPRGNGCRPCGRRWAP